MVYGSLLNDSGNLVLSTVEKDELLRESPESEVLIRRFIGSREFLRGEVRWCLYIKEDQLGLARSIDEVSRRLDAVAEHRRKSTEASTRALSDTPHRFYFSAHTEGDAMIVPRTSSERREYIPIGLLRDDTIISDAAQAIYSPPIFLFSILSSRMHMTWVRAVAGRLKTDYRYSSALCYNPFPFPELSESSKSHLEDLAFAVLDAREVHTEKTIAQMYDPDKMPESLREIHRELDEAVDRCYSKKVFPNDADRLTELFRRFVSQSS